MNLVLQREVLTDKSTIGRINWTEPKQQFFWSMEDPVVPVGVPKRYGATAIPTGRYKVVITYSKRFQRPMPLLVGVPDFDGIRIHSGNTSADTEGCILIGLQKGVDSIGRSRAAMDLFMPKLEEGLKQGEVWIEVLNPRKETP